MAVCGCSGSHALGSSDDFSSLIRTSFLQFVWCNFQHRAAAIGVTTNSGVPIVRFFLWPLHFVLLVVALRADHLTGEFRNQGSSSGIFF